jgi:hypothetical protein
MLRLGNALLVLFGLAGLAHAGYLNPNIKYRSDLLDSDDNMGWVGGNTFLFGLDHLMMGQAWLLSYGVAGGVNARNYVVASDFYFGLQFPIAENVRGFAGAGPELVYYRLLKKEDTGPYNGIGQMTSIQASALKGKTGIILSRKTNLSLALDVGGNAPVLTLGVGFML